MNEQGDILIGMQNGCIMEIKQNGQKQIFMQCHSAGELWGLDVNAAGQIVTSGDDNKIMVWDAAKHCCLGSALINGAEEPKGDNQESRAVAINPVNGHVAICCNDGSLQVRESLDNLSKVLYNSKDFKEWSEAISYSPDGTQLAVGNHDNGIYIYKIEGESYTLD